MLMNQDVDSLLVLPWNLIDEIKKQLPGMTLITAIPKLIFHHGHPDA
jgi:hypothetical protein